MHNIIYTTPTKFLPKLLNYKEALQRYTILLLIVCLLIPNENVSSYYTLKFKLVYKVREALTKIMCKLDYRIITTMAGVIRKEIHKLKMISFSLYPSVDQLILGF